MLLYFKTSNNLSYQEETEFSLIAGPYKDHLENTIELPKYKTRVLKSSVIYGANASGKSNLLKAIIKGVWFIKDSFSMSQNDHWQPFIHNLNDQENESQPITHTYGILIDNTHFEYYFSLNKKRIEEEYLLEYRSQKPIKHFQRKFNKNISEYEWQFSASFPGERESVKNITNDRTLFLTIGSQAKLPVAITVLNWFRAHINWSVDHSSPGNLSPDSTLHEIKENPAMKEFIVKALTAADFTITDIEVIESGGRLKGITTHKTKNKNGEESLAKFDLTNEESAGTIRYIAWLGVWLDVLSYGKTLLIDELGSSMHSLLSKGLIDAFHSTNKTGAQLIFTTHDTNLMTPELFRRDQIWIVDKDGIGNSKLYPVSDFKIKKNKILENAYLQGVYGGIPHLIDVRFEKETV